MAWPPVAKTTVGNDEIWPGEEAASLSDLDRCNRQPRVLLPVGQDIRGLVPKRTERVLGMPFPRF